MTDAEFNRQLLIASFEGQVNALLGAADEARQESGKVFAAGDDAAANAWRGSAAWLESKSKIPASWVREYKEGKR